MKTLWNVVGDFCFPHKILFTNTQVSELPRVFGNNSSANIKLSKIQLHKIGQSGEFLGRHLGPSLKTGLSSLGNVLKPLVKSVLISLGLRAAVSAANSAIQKKMPGSGTTTLTISNEKMNDIM